MITTVTLNASIDKAYFLSNTFNKGKVFRVDKVRNSAGGKGLNVARVIHLNGCSVVATGFLAGYNGKYLENLLEKDHIDHAFFHVDGETRSCINIIDKDNISTELLEPGMTVSEENLQQYREKLREIVADSKVVSISGSLPRGVRSDYYATLITDLKQIGKKVTLDTSGEALVAGINASPTLVKPNIEEIEQLFHTKINNEKELVQYMKKIASSGVKYVVVSLGSKGAIMLHQDKILLGTPPKIHAVNTVGCGDSMVAAFSMGLDQELETAELLKSAIAFGAANALSSDTGYFDKHDLDRMLADTTITLL